MDMLDGETEVRDYNLERLMMLSDGVFAIAMTLLALDVRLPPISGATLPGLLGNLAQILVPFAWGFFGAGIYWTVHRRMFGLYCRADAVVTALTLIMLGEITLIPVVIRILMDMKMSAPAVATYIGLCGLIGVTNACNWIYAAFFRGSLLRPGMGPASKATVAVMHAILPATMTGLGVYSTQDGYQWTPLLMPAVMGLATVARRLARKFDERTGRSGEPVPSAEEAQMVHLDG